LPRWEQRSTEREEVSRRSLGRRGRGDAGVGGRSCAGARASRSLPVAALHSLRLCHCVRVCCCCNPSRCLCVSVSGRVSICPIVGWPPLARARDASHSSKRT
jgi:hypothetical protein